MDWCKIWVKGRKRVVNIQIILTLLLRLSQKKLLKYCQRIILNGVYPKDVAIAHLICSTPVL